MEALSWKIFHPINTDQVYPNVTMEDLLFETQDNEQTLLTDLKLLLIV